MFNTSQSSRPTATTPGRKRAAALPRLTAVTAVGLLSLTACSNADGARDASASSSPGGASGSSEAQESASQDTGVITEGAADEAWKKQARQAAADHNSVDPTPCLDDLLDQKTLDAVATALPEVGGMYLSGLFTDAGCIFTGANDPHEWDESMDHIATVEIRRYYLANDDLGEGHALDESGFLQHDQCTDDVKTDDNGVATIYKHGVSDSNIHGGSAAVELQAAWHCSQDGATTSAVLTKPDLAIEMATRLSEAGSDWAPAMDEIYEKNFKDIMGQ